MSFIIQSIMVVDDEIELATLFKTFLNKQGYDVISFVDPVFSFSSILKRHQRDTLQ